MEIFKKTTAISKGDTLLMREAIDEAIKHSRINKPTEIDDEVDELVMEYASKMSNLNFNNDLLKKEKKKQQDIIDKKRNNKLIGDVNEAYAKKYPNHTIIPLADLLVILKKYNLFSGDTKYYNKMIPQRNLEEISDFWNTSTPHSFGMVHFNLNSLSDMEAESVSDLEFNESSYRSAKKITSASMRIIAPLNEFTIGKEEQIIGQFIVHDKEFDEKNIKKPIPVNLDPIVYVPVKYPTPGGAVLIISQWGPEADIPEFNK